MWHDGHELLEWGVGSAVFWAVKIHFEGLDYGFTAEEIRDNILAKIRDHGRVVERVVPAPVLRATVVVVEDPLDTFDVLAEEGAAHLLAAFFRDVDVQLGVVVFGLGSVLINCIGFNEIAHKVVIGAFDLQSLLFRLSYLVFETTHR